MRYHIVILGCALFRWHSALKNQRKAAKLVRREHQNTYQTEILPSWHHCRIIESRGTFLVPAASRASYTALIYTNQMNLSYGYLLIFVLLVVFSMECGLYGIVCSERWFRFCFADCCRRVLNHVYAIIFTRE